MAQEVIPGFGHHGDNKFPATPEKIDEPSFNSGLEGLFVDLSDPFGVFDLLRPDCEHRRAVLSVRLGRATKTKKRPRCKRKPDEEKGPYAAL